MTILRSFINKMADLGYGEFNKDLFASSVPIRDDSNPVLDAAWWVVANGGAPTQDNDTGEKLKSYRLSVHYRNTNGEDVDEKLHEFETLMNSKQCLELEGFEVHDVSATSFGTDGDIDEQDRILGMVEVTISVYQSGNI